MAIAIFETRHGLLAHYTEDRVIGQSLDRYGEWAEEEIYLVSRFLSPGDTVLDIGANVGSHTIALSRVVGEMGRVVAVDGQRRASEILNLNLLLNGTRNVSRIEGLVGCVDRVERVAEEAGASIENLGGKSFVAGLGRGTGLPVPLFTIDSLALTTCRLMKIDVEGMEFDVMQGAVETLRRYRPVVYFEQTTPLNFSKIADLLRGLGYDLYWHVANPFNRANYRGDPINIFGGTCEVNVLAVHHSEAFALPKGIEAPAVAGDRYDPPPSATGLSGWDLPPEAYADLPPACRQAMVAMPPPPDLVSRADYDRLQMRFCDLEQDRTRAQEIMTYQADLIARLRQSEAA